MSLNDYVKAQKLGEKRYQAALSKNEYPYLPVLDELITNSDIAGEVNLGLQHISLDRVVQRQKAVLQHLQVTSCLY